MEKNKKIIAGIIIAILVVVFAILAWFIFLNDSPNGETIDNNSPFGTPGSQTGGNGFPEQGVSGGTGSLPPPAIPFSNTNRLNRISEAPVAGATILGTGTSTKVRYLEKATGHIYEVELSSGNRNRVTNTTAPKIVEALWGDRGSFIVLRSVENGMINSVAGTVSSSTASTTTDGSLDLLEKRLILNIQNIAFSPSKKSSFYTTVGEPGIQGFLSNATLEKPSLVWSFPTWEWIVEWPKEDTLAFTTKASHGEHGYLLFFNPSKKTSQKILDNIPGLTTKTSPDASLVVYSASKDGDSSTFLYETDTRISLDLELKTFPEKCAWAGNTIYCGVPKSGVAGEMPDMWYQGMASFTDSLWKITRMGQEVVKKEEIDLSQEAKGSIDLIDPQLSTDGKTLIFRNKKDSFLWALSLSAE